MDSVDQFTQYFFFMLMMLPSRRQLNTDALNQVSSDQPSQGSTAGETPEHLPAPVQKVVDAIPHDFALASRTVFYGMAGVMAVAFLIALVRMPGGKVEEEM